MSGALRGGAGVLGGPGRNEGEHGCEGGGNAGVAKGVGRGWHTGYRGGAEGGEAGEANREHLGSQSLHLLPPRRVQRA